MKNLEILSPESFFGFKLGSDKKIARWDKIVEYFNHLGQNSDRIKVIELGKTTEHNPFILAYISSPENIQNLATIREMSWNISHPKDLSSDEIERIIHEGKTVIEITNSMHANEIGGTQMAPELAYELCTSEEPLHLNILSNTVLILFPCLNPDGQLMITDWYNRWLGTEYEGVGLPWLYQKYVGHDNNRDTITHHMPETKMWAKITFQEWYPQAYLDHHHMGSYAARFYVPPEAPGWIDENIESLIWTEERLYGGNMADRLENAGCYGVEYETFLDEFMTTTNHVCRRLGICGMLTESASAKLATPIYIHQHQIQPGDRNRPGNNKQTNFPHPWPGGWWSLNNIVTQQKVASLGVLEVASMFRERILRNMYVKASNSIRLGAHASPYALIIPPWQNDLLATQRFLESYLRLGVEIHEAAKDFVANNVIYPKGTWVIFAGQISRPYLLATLRKSEFNDRPWNRTGDGTPIPTKDPAASTLFEYMGVKIIESPKKFDGEFTKLTEITRRGRLGESSYGYLFDASLESHAVVNLLLINKKRVYRTKADEDKFLVLNDDGVKEILEDMVDKLAIDFVGLSEKYDGELEELTYSKVGLYQRYYGGNMQEGWTRFMLEKYKFSYHTLKDDEIKAGNLNEKFDVIIIPSDPSPLITGKDLEKWWNEKRMYSPFPHYPPEYRSGVGDEGIKAFDNFVTNGGKLVTLNEASNFAIEELKLPVKNRVKDLPPTEYLCSGSTLKVEVNKNLGFTHGVPPNSLILVTQNSPVFEVKQNDYNEKIEVGLSYPQRDVMESGWVIGEKYFSGRPALLKISRGKGSVILFGFEPIFRGQTTNSFKLLFNNLL